MHDGPPVPAPCTAVDERLGEISPDLPYELQFRAFEQLTNIGIGGAGITITLVGGLLKNSGPYVWLAAIEFLVGALVALSAQSAVIEHLFARKAFRKKARMLTAIATVLIGMGVGSLTMSVLLD